MEVDLEELKYKLNIMKLQKETFILEKNHVEKELRRTQCDNRLTSEEKEKKIAELNKELREVEKNHNEFMSKYKEIEENIAFLQSTDSNEEEIEETQESVTHSASKNRESTKNSNDIQNNKRSEDTIKETENKMTSKSNAKNYTERLEDAFNTIIASLREHEDDDVMNLLCLSLSKNAKIENKFKSRLKKMANVGMKDKRNVRKIDINLSETTDEEEEETLSEKQILSKVSKSMIKFADNISKSLSSSQNKEKDWIRKPPKFYGGTSIRSWLDKFEYCALANGWEEDKWSNFCGKALEGSAGDIFINTIGFDTDLRWEEVREKLCEAFGSKHESKDAFDKMISMQKRWHRSNAEYVNEMFRLQHIVDPKMSTDLLMNLIIKGLPPEIRQMVTLGGSCKKENIIKKINEAEYAYKQKFSNPIDVRDYVRRRTNWRGYNERLHQDGIYNAKKRRYNWKEKTWKSRDQSSSEEESRQYSSRYKNKYDSVRDKRYHKEYENDSGSSQSESSRYSRKDRKYDKEGLNTRHQRSDRSDRNEIESGNWRSKSSPSTSENEERNKKWNSRKSKVYAVNREETRERLHASNDEVSSSSPNE